MIRPLKLLLITHMAILQHVSSQASAQEYQEPTNCTQTFDHSWTLDGLLDQFRDDDIRRNMTKAWPIFWSHPDLSVDYIYKALNHEDWQISQVMCRQIWLKLEDSRVMVPNPVQDDGQWAGVTERIIPADPEYTITPDLIRVTIEGLKHDTSPFDRSRRRGLVYFNADFGVSKLIPVAHLWVNELEEALESDDDQQRLLCAYILGRAGISRCVEPVSKILLPHLRDNDISDDAKFSVYALGGFGPELLPYLKDALPGADDQQRDLISLLIVNLIDPVFTDDERAQRSVYNSITQAVHDPSAQQVSVYFGWMNPGRR